MRGSRLKNWEERYWRELKCIWLSGVEEKKLLLLQKYVEEIYWCEWCTVTSLLNDDTKYLDWQEGLPKSDYSDKGSYHLCWIEWKRDGCPCEEITNTSSCLLRRLTKTKNDTSLSGTWVCEMDMQSLFNHMKLDEMIIESLTWRECFLWRFVKHSSFIFNTSLWTSSGVTVSPRRRASIMTVETWIALSSSLISRRIWFRRMKDSFFSYPSVQTTNETSRSWRTSSCRVICCLMAASSFRKASSCFSI